MLTILFIHIYFTHSQIISPVRPGYEYSDSFARNDVWPLIIASMPDRPEYCLKNTLPSVKVQARVLVNCSNTATLPASCYSYLVVNAEKKLIAIISRGTKEETQMELESQSMTMPKAPFYNVGLVQPYFNYAMDKLWREGIAGNLTLLKQRYPDYDLLVAGHSLGGAISSLLSSRIIYEKIYPVSRVKFMSFGQPRTGDLNYVNWVNNNFLYNYRIVMRNDPAPRMPPNSAGYFHHRWDILYNNDMIPGSSYTISAVDNGLTATLDDDFLDHLLYFGKSLDVWKSLRCSM